MLATADSMGDEMTNIDTDLDDEFVKARTALNQLEDILAKVYFRIMESEAVDEFTIFKEKKAVKLLDQMHDAIMGLHEEKSRLRKALLEAAIDE